MENNNKEFGVILFNTTTSAIRAEKFGQKEGLDVKLVSTPRQFSSDCGLSLKFPWEILDKVIEIIEIRKIEYASKHKL
ncbi:MAG: DUF3343 domain-containing protein [Planctomycetes bacterium]|nr:DUF3343 domain-containing protein [Planctomycetota bacterium]